MRLAVVGAGWAGLAAAVHLKAQAAQVTVFEAAPLPGGRARRVEDLQMGAIDNGQHLLLGAYTETLALMRTLRPALPLDELLQRFPMHLESATGDFCLKAAPLAAPFHTLWGLLNANGLTWADRWQALRMLTSLKLQRWQIEPNATVAQLLRQHGQSALLRRRLWIPLCLATLNTSEDEACAQLFLNVLRDSMDAPRAHSDMLLARVDLTTLWPQAAADAVAMRYRQVVRNVHPTSSQVVIDGEAFDGCVVAVPPYAAARMLTPEKPCAQSEALLAQLQAFTYRAIATLALQLDAPWPLPRPLLMLDELAARGHVGQWLFSRPDRPDQLTVVISDAEDFLKHDRVEFVGNITTQIQEQLQRRALIKNAIYVPMPRIKAHRLIVEKRATFAAVPGLQRPSNTSPWTRLTLAGDWTDTGYPSVLEGAVRSGKRAAQNLLTNLHSMTKY